MKIKQEDRMANCTLAGNRVYLRVLATGMSFA